MNVIVVGAGMAGLAAANYLVQHNINVVVLEVKSFFGNNAWCLSFWFKRSK